MMLPVAENERPPARRVVRPARPPVLLVPGLGDSGPGHWQSIWERHHPSMRRVVQPDWTTPRLDVWAATVASAIDACRAPPIVVAHGFGCLAAVRAAWLHERELAGALLVAPADPDLVDAGSKMPKQRLPYPGMLVAGSNDPSLKLIKAGMLAARWELRFFPLAGAGHLNEASGHGPWPEGIPLLQTLIHAIADRARGAPERVQGPLP